MDIALVGCGSKKRLPPESEKLVTAKELYTSSYFNLKQDVAEEYDLWFILSAKYGLVNPEQMIKPYDVKLTTKLDPFEGDDDPDFDTLDEWAGNIVDSLNNIITHGQKYNSNIDSITLLAGKAYVNPIIDYIVSNNIQADINQPFKNTSGLFEQMDWLKQQKMEDNNTKETTQTRLTDQ
jgi:hypothetical protein